MASTFTQKLYLLNSHKGIRNKEASCWTLGGDHQTYSRSISNMMLFVVGRWGLDQIYIMSWISKDTFVFPNCTKSASAFTRKKRGKTFFDQTKLSGHLMDSKVGVFPPPKRFSLLFLIIQKTWKKWKVLGKFRKFYWTFEEKGKQVGLKSR